MTQMVYGSRTAVRPQRWPVIIEEAQALATLLAQEPIEGDRFRAFLDEVQKAVKFFARSGFDPGEMTRFLDRMAVQPPQRSNQTRRYYMSLRKIWRTPRKHSLSSLELGYAWSWALRLARAWNFSGASTGGGNAERQVRPPASSSRR